MATPIYRFGAFRLDPQARELIENGARVNLRISTIDCLIYLVRHRDRPVGRDELASAVWGRVDVSEVSLTHAIMGLRRTLGDTGNDQRIIRTVPRLGYRWVHEGTIEESPDDAATDPAPVAPPATEPVPPPRQRSRVPPLAVAALIVVAALAFAWRYFAAAEPPPPARAAMVLPAAVEAPADAAWLRLGLMDLVADRLRRGDIATAPSETVVALVNARNGAAPDAAQAGLLVRPSASLAQTTWTVRLDAASPQRRLVVEARDGDPIAAARRAADELLIKLGRKPPDVAGGDAPLALDTLRRRASAALLAGQVDLARRLLDEAPPALLDEPTIAVSRAQVEFYAGRYDDSRRLFEAVLERLPADAPVDLRARALSSLGAAYFRLGRVDDAATVYAQAARLTDAGGDAQTRAKAYSGLGAVASQRLELDAAATMFGRARTLFELANDMNGIASIDLNLGLNAMQRGQPAAALTMLRGVGARFAELGFHDALIAAKVATVDAELATLDAPAALATSDDFARLGAQANARQRGELELARAAALAANGRLRDADAALAHVLDAADPHEEAMLRARAQALAARLALARGEFALAATLAEAALIAPLEKNLRPDYLAAWSTRIAALRGAGLDADAAAELARLVAWSQVDAKESDRVAVALAQAEQAAAERRTDAALARYADAMAAAAGRGVPEDVVAVGYAYAPALIAAGRLDEAAAISGRLAPWAERDARAAWVAAGVYAALGQDEAAQTALARARRLAAERTLPALATRATAKPAQ
ncbi:winged helix-turn-helix domain-containing protein [Tahibacter soli]|uniref:Winged helix-turn-helix domain-containing protein n=1 Tax=Tahibacter soli TaxID=2983605 RepID=A0A9X4BIP2_9GAMM|nr:winged helix-turn-helix domain-containing protein [Tahibacter soli]MDC8012447.1 winged helix-turn-helix domain-containing protein [Tahibacter soli]